MRFTHTALVLALGLAASACGKSNDEALAAESSAPVVGVLELPLSHRAADAAPTGAARIEISPTELRLDGRKLLDLVQGSAPAAEVSDHVITKLRDGLTSGPARSAAEIRMHVNTTYSTMVDLLKTVDAANIHRVGFVVRPIQRPTETGFLVIENFRVEAPSDEPIRFEGAHQRQWNDFVAAWQEGYTGCRARDYVDCSPYPAVPMTGGDLLIKLFARGSALKAEFSRFGGEDPVEAAPPVMLDGVPAPPPAGEGEFEPPDPIGQGAFTWRFEAATADLSGIKDAFRPLCGAHPCGVVVTGDINTLSMRLLSFIGAAFPDGTPAPALAFVIPEN
jgi:hypothetical protein